MKHTETVLIVVDGSAKIRQIADSIGACFHGARVVVMDAADFAATDLLPADSFFVGCEKPRPPSFAELERVLAGINLAGRPCGLFSLASNEAIEYLRGVVRDADLRLNPTPLLAASGAAAKAWTAETLGRR